MCVQETTVSWMDGGSRLSAGLLTSSLTPFQAVVNPAATVTLKKPQVSSFPSSVMSLALSASCRNSPFILSETLQASAGWCGCSQQNSGLHGGAPEVSGKLGQENVIVPQVKRGF